MTGKGLPYVDNLRVILFVVAVNAGCLFLFYLGKQIILYGVLSDAVNCGISTSFITVYLIHYLLEKKRAAGELPADVPVSRFISHFPKRPFLLSAAFSVIFAALMLAVTWLLILFYDIHVFSFSAFMIWKILYCCILTAKVQELAVLRYVQPDCQSDSSIVQRGNAEVKNPLPKIGTFKELFNTVTDDFGFNLIMAMLTGGAVIYEGSVIIFPTARASILISSIVLGAIVSLRMVYPIAVTIAGIAEKGLIPADPSAKKNKLLSIIPENPRKLVLLFCIPVILLSCLVFYLVFTVFDFESLNFFQFFLVRTLYTTLLSKAIVHLLILRYSLPD